MTVSLCVAVAASALLVLLLGCAEAADKPNLVTLLVRPTVGESTIRDCMADRRSTGCCIPNGRVTVLHA